MICNIELDVCLELTENGVLTVVFAGDACCPALEGNTSWEKLAYEYINARRVGLTGPVDASEYDNIRETARSLREAAEALENAIPT